jgi:hypothetical protein
MIAANSMKKPIPLIQFFLCDNASRDEKKLSKVHHDALTGSDKATCS